MHTEAARDEFDAAMIDPQNLVEIRVRTGHAHATISRSPSPRMTAARQALTCLEESE